MKFFGKIGFVYEVEDPPESGIWTDRSEEREAYGDVLSNVYRWREDSDVNTDLTTSNRISIMADRFMYEHMGAMRYVRWNGTVWSISSVDTPGRPRIILSLGGVYKGRTETTT